MLLSNRQNFAVIARLRKWGGGCSAKGTCSHTNQDVLAAETLVERAMELDHVGGTFGGNSKPTPFICLVLKMLQIQPEKDIIVEFIKNEEYKYVRALGAFYMRLVGKPVDVYNYLEPVSLEPFVYCNFGEFYRRTHISRTCSGRQTFWGLSCTRFVGSQETCALI